MQDISRRQRIISNEAKTKTRAVNRRGIAHHRSGWKKFVRSLSAIRMVHASPRRQVSGLTSQVAQPTFSLDAVLRDEPNELFAIERMTAGAGCEMFDFAAGATRRTSAAAGAEGDAAVAGRINIDSTIAAIWTAAAGAAGGKPRIDDRVATGTVNVKHGTIGST
jgi:hypothetical protein